VGRREPTFGTQPESGWTTDLQGEGEDHVRLGQRVLILLAHVHDGGVVTSLQLLQLELPALGDGHALQVGHKEVDRGTQLLHKHGLHLLGHKLGELAALRRPSGQHRRMNGNGAEEKLGAILPHASHTVHIFFNLHLFIAVFFYVFTLFNVQCSM